VTVTTLTTSEFNRTQAGPRKLRERAGHVVLTIEDYQRLAGPTGRRISISSRRALEAFSRRLISTDVPDRRARIQIGARIDSIIPPIASQASVGPD
jgi:hypothetical protein